jgi:ATP-dependent Clp protease ATP-binding subunit ClpC
MSEFMERHNVAQMIGAPAGYIGYGEGGKLTERVRRNPYSLVLFDEIEKAHPDVFNILLSILDEGRLTDAEGRTVSFRNTIIFLTSNIGTASFTQTAKIGFGRSGKAAHLPQEFEAIKREVLEELKKTLRPELLGRIDQTLVFEPLDQKAIVAIVRIVLARLRARLAKESIVLSISPSAVSLLAKKSFAPESGARLVRRIIEAEVEERIATLLLQEKRPTKRITLTTKNDEIVCHLH